MATEPEVKAAGIVAGAASPVGLKGVKIVADDSVVTGVNFVAGGNKPETHLKNVNYPRDFKADIVADIAQVAAGDACEKCGGKLASTRGIEVGHVFKLGTSYSKILGANFIDAAGNSQPAVMGCYGIGVGRLMAAAIEQNHDDKGIIWPLPIAPYQVYLCPLYRDGTKVAEVAEKLYTEFPKRPVWKCFSTTARNRPALNSTMPIYWAFRCVLPSAPARWRKTPSRSNGGKKNRPNSCR